MIGKTISHYKILEKLGAGGMGEVYKAEDLKLKRTVALKFLPPLLTSDSETKERFIHEAQAASSLDHPNICTIHEIDETDNGQIFICMDYYEGETLKKKIEQKPLNIEEAIDIATQIAEGLSKSHKKGIIHRDIKPANIIITDESVVKIVDFGLAKLAGQTKLTKTGTTVGTAAYMSPEQVRGEDVNHGTDIWSLGVVLYEMLTGKLPFKGEHEQAMMYSIVHEDPVPVTDVGQEIPIDLAQIVSTALAKEPEERYDSTRDLVHELNSVFERSIRAGDKSSTVTKTSPTRRNYDSRKYLEELKKDSVGKELGKLIAYSKLLIKNDIVHVTFNTSDKIVNALNEIAQKIPRDSDEILFINQGGGEITLVFENDKEALFKNILSQAIEIRKKTAVVRILESKVGGVKASINVPGLYAFFINQVSKNNINILDIISTKSQLTLVIDEEDLTLTYSILNACTKYFRSKENNA